LTETELIRWSTGKKVDLKNTDRILFRHKSGHYYLDDKEGLVLKRLMHERASKKKIVLARKAVKLLSFIPSVQMVGLTGALAMNNASEESDIDLMIVTSKNSLWVTRILSYALLLTFGFKVRRFGQKNEKNKLCLNIWLDETSLGWRGKKNIYTAHEISQTIPLFDRGVYGKLISENEWIKEYWPNAVGFRGDSQKEAKKSILSIFENIARVFQFNYMSKKRTRETVGKKIALFHPTDWSEIVLGRLEKYLDLL
jgi:predicted nucleotidyltransferase